MSAPIGRGGPPGPSGYRGPPGPSSTGRGGPTGPLQRSNQAGSSAGQDLLSSLGETLMQWIVPSEGQSLAGRGGSSTGHATINDTAQRRIVPGPSGVGRGCPVTYNERGEPCASIGGSQSNAGSRSQSSDVVLDRQGRAHAAIGSSSGGRGNSNARASIGGSSGQHAGIGNDRNRL